MTSLSARCHLCTRHAVKSVHKWHLAAGGGGSVADRGEGLGDALEAAALGVVSRLLESGDVRVFIDGVFPLSAAGAAHAQLETGHTRGKLVLTVAEG